MHKLWLRYRSRSRANALRDAKRPAEAAALYKQAIDLGARSLAIRKQLANMLKDSGQFEAALKEYQACLTLAPENSDTLLQLGHLFKMQQMDGKAFDYYRRAALANPPSLDALQHLLSQDARLASSPDDTANSRSVDEEELRNQWHSFVPLFLNSVSAIARMGSDLEEFSKWTRNEIEVLKTQLAHGSRSAGIADLSVNSVGSSSEELAKEPDPDSAQKSVASDASGLQSMRR